MGQGEASAGDVEELDDVLRAPLERAREDVCGMQGIASGRPRNAHVVALDDVTTLTILPAGTNPIGEPEAEPARRAHTRTLPSGDQVDALVSTCIDVSAFVGHRLRATAAHRSQYPIDPEMFP